MLDTALEGKRFLVGDTFSIADIASFCWVICAPCVSFASPSFRVMFHVLYAGSRLPPALGAADVAGSAFRRGVCE